MAQTRSEKRRSFIPRRSPSVSHIPLPAPSLSADRTATNPSHVESTWPLSPEAGGQKANGSRIPISLASAALNQNALPLDACPPRRSDGESPLPPFSQQPPPPWSPGGGNGNTLSISRNSSGRVISELQQQLYEVRGEVESLKLELKGLQKRNGVLLTERDEARERGRLETEGLARNLDRKSRLLIETTARTLELQAEKEIHARETQRLTTLESLLAESQASAVHSNQAYLSLGLSLDALKLRWKTEMDQLKVQMGAALKATEQAVEQKVALEKETAKGHTLREELMDRIGRDLDGRARVDEGLGTGLAEVKIEMARIRSLLITSMTDESDQSSTRAARPSI